MDRYTLDLAKIDPTDVALVGGKGARLGELLHVQGTVVPAGFCVTTAAFERTLEEAPAIARLRDRLRHTNPLDEKTVRMACEEIRTLIVAVGMPDDVSAAIRRSAERLGDATACAVRSSATDEDRPRASFAGQHDSFLNVIGPEAILRHVTKCWASLFNDRAVAYRQRQGQPPRQSAMAVVVQQMVFPETAGILFTADPVSGNRKVISIESCFGLGEPLVSGTVNADVFKIRDNRVVSKVVATKSRATRAASGGGTEERPVSADQQRRESLTDEQALELARLGRRIEGHFGRPQDIEWCLTDDGFQVVQSRPITTLFPIPVSGDGENRLYLSVGHQQMMTDPLKPLGLSFWQMTTPVPMAEAGGRLFVDVTRRLEQPASRTSLLKLMSKSDPLTRDAIQTILDRGDFLRPLPSEGSATQSPRASAAGIDADPAVVVALMEGTQASLATLRQEIHGKSGDALLAYIRTDIAELRRLLFDPKSHQVFMSAIEATWWLNEHLEAWLGEKNAADTLTQSVPFNITSEMGLALLDVADVIRPHPEVITFLTHAEREDFLDDLQRLVGGREAAAALQAWLEKYGMRGIGEIDITRPRWKERPTLLLPMLLGNIRNLEAGEATRRFEEGRQQAAMKEDEVLGRLRARADGPQMAEDTKRQIDRLRTFIGYREYPKYGMVSRYFIYKQALLDEADRCKRMCSASERISSISASTKYRMWFGHVGSIRTSSPNGRTCSKSFRDSCRRGC